MSHEIELKLALPQRALAALRRHALVAAAQKLGTTTTLDNTYFDTPSLALKARKVAVRTRRGKDLGSMDVNEVIEKLQQEIRSRSLQQLEE